MPMSYNAWLYGYGNPVRYVDLNGNFPILPPDFLLHFFGVIPDSYGLSIVQAHKATFDAIDPSEVHNIHKTTLAAAIAVQSQWLLYPTDLIKSWAYEYLPCGGISGAIKEKILKSASVGYAKINYNKVSNEDLFSMEVSIKEMANRIYNVTQVCEDDKGNPLCSPLDTLIAASMAQNGGFSRSDMELNIIDRIHVDEYDGHSEIDWEMYFNTVQPLRVRNPSAPYNYVNDLRALNRVSYNTRFMLHLFTQDMQYLHNNGWELPPRIYEHHLNWMNQLALTGRAIWVK
jgi:hypothetical protein